jgi:hypothetical protein
MKIAGPLLIGFLLKHTVKRPNWLENEGVEEICSVSTCISEAPDNWFDKWPLNEFGFCNSEAIMLSIIKSEVKQYDIYAYKLFPYKFDDCEIIEFKIPFRISAELTDFQLLGYDAVNSSAGSQFECSALSCNNGARNFSVNRYCLFKDIFTAYDATKVISKGPGYEPGPWYVLEVYRKILKKLS